MLRTGLGVLCEQEVKVSLQPPVMDLPLIDWSSANASTIEKNTLRRDANNNHCTFN